VNVLVTTVLPVATGTTLEPEIVATEVVADDGALHVPATEAVGYVRAVEPAVIAIP
jgi:hypothetical protein